eukprot:TRINITY_DN3899_c0_g1_i2.p1 TRINITY_DN3899_c0_g1~~TRINITY_DN3899_c0_g1_i2.p1  ORF type:complete len:375 (+),score=118.85 TRINITY_DN3899_c0_g1_i2:91-1215(+)
MPIEGALVARGRNILALYVSPGSNFVEVSKKLLAQIPTDHDTKKSYTHQGFMFHFVVERGITYLCMSDSQMGFRAPYALLYDLISKVKANYPHEVSTATEIPPLSRIIKEQTIFFNDARNSDKTGKLRSQVDEVKNQMINNVDKVIARGEKIEEVLEKTQELQEHSYTFKVKAKEVKRKMWWKNLKVKIVCIIILVIALAGGIAIALKAAGVIGKSSDSQPVPSSFPSSKPSISASRPSIINPTLRPTRSRVTRTSRNNSTTMITSAKLTTTAIPPPVPTSISSTSSSSSSSTDEILSSTSSESSTTTTIETSAPVDTTTSSSTEGSTLPLVSSSSFESTSDSTTSAPESSVSSTSDKSESSASVVPSSSTDGR